MPRVKRYLRPFKKFQESVTSESNQHLTWGVEHMDSFLQGHYAYQV